MIEGSARNVDDLIRASHVRHLTDDERLQVAAATFTPDEAMERARLIRERHPDLFAGVLTDTQLGLDRYIERRQTAIEAGRTVADPDAAAVAELDELAGEVRATADVDVRAVLRTVEREGREAFRAAVGAGNFAAVVAVFRAWLNAADEADELLNRRARARRLFRPDELHNPQPRPGFLRELEAAVDGGSSFGSSIGAGEADLFASER